MALFLLRSLKSNHIINKEENFIVPCCGNLYISNENRDTVQVLGCANGKDWTVVHSNDKIEIITESGTRIELEKSEYRRSIFKFSDEIQLFYKKSSPKVLPDDEFDRNGYLAFWNEWSRHREVKFDVNKAK